MSVRWQQIRTLAADVRQTYAERAVPLTLLPLDLDELAETLYDLTVVPTTTLSEGVQGKVEPELQVIRVRRDLPAPRQRFVIAHELGHVALEGLHAGGFLDTDETLDERAAGERANDSAVRTYNTRERHEQEANLFALELLIPADELWKAVQQEGWQLADLATRFGVSLDAMRTQLINVCCVEPLTGGVEPHAAGAHLPPDPEQQAAVDAPLPLLLAAGPGTGKTRSIVAKYTTLVRQGVDPARILALTFSNKAADEMRGRIVAALQRSHPALAGRVEISTFHAWGLNILRTYGPHLGLPLDVKLLDIGDLYLLLLRNLAKLQLDHFKDIRNPPRHLLTIISAISRIKDELRTPEEYAALAETEAERLVQRAETEHGGTTKKDQQARERAARQAAALREMAAIYPRYEAILREHGVLDYGDLIVLACRALNDPEVASALRAQYQYILVDEFQDINYASGELLRLLDGGRGRVWAVGDAWQSIYRFRGASAANLDQFAERFAGASVVHLTRNYRSLQPILDAAQAVMADDPGAPERPALQAQRGEGWRRHVVEWVAPTRRDEYTAIAHDILRRVGKRARVRPQCLGNARRPLLPARRSRVVRLTRRPAQPPRRWRFRDHAVLCRKHDHVAQVAAVLEAHGIPVDSIRDVFETPEVKDALAICAQVGATNSAGLLRALTMADHRLDPADLHRLVERARRTNQSLPRAAREPQIVAQLSPPARRALDQLHAVLDDLAAAGDAWEVLSTYLFEHSKEMRERLVRAGRGDGTAQRELDNLGGLLMTVRNFVRQAPPGEQGAAHFIEYIRALRAAGATPSQSIAGNADVVRVMTVHAAKGLEFPIVYLPHLQEGQFPAQGGRPGLPQPGGLVRGTQESEQQEERYLLYVAMTRARDQLVLTRSLDGGKKSNGEPKVAERSSLLPGGPNGDEAPWHVRPIPTEDGCPEVRPEIRLRDNPPPRMPLPASSIDLDGCRRRFLYQYVYQLYDDQSPYLRMHQAIRESVKQLLEAAQENGIPSQVDSVRAILLGQLQRYELEDVLYAEDYEAEAWRHVQGVWEELRSTRLTPDDVNARVVVERPAGAIEIRVDRIEHANGQPRWVWTRSGQPGDDDHLSERVMLYALAQQARGVGGEITIHYTTSGERRGAAPSPKVLGNHTAKIDALLEQMQAGRWEPTFGPHCDTCPFNLICPV